MKKIIFLLFAIGMIATAQAQGLVDGQIYSGVAVLELAQTQGWGGDFQKDYSPVGIYQYSAAKNQFIELSAYKEEHNPAPTKTTWVNYLDSKYETHYEFRKKGQVPAYRVVGWSDEEYAEYCRIRQMAERERKNTLPGGFLSGFPTDGLPRW